MSLRIGLTGGIGSGKTTVCKLFSGHGVPVFDADEIARQLVSPGQPALQTIMQEFGEGVIDAQGQLRRDQLRTLVFRDPEKRRRLEQTLHPLIVRELENQACQCHAPYCILSIPLLIEKGLHRLVHRVLVVDCSEALRIQRVMDRDHLTAEQVKAIMQAQVSDETRLEIADDVIVNETDIAALEKQVAALHEKYLGLSFRHNDGV